MDQSVFLGFLLAIALGALIGTEREMPWSGTKIGGAAGFGGIRSYALLCLIGAICTWLDRMLDVDFWKYTGFIISAVFVIVGYGYSSFAKDRMGVTSEYAALITYLIGIIIMSGYSTAAVILAILLLILLSSKEHIAIWRDRFSREELGNTLKFAVISLVVLPLLPDQKYSILEMANGLSGVSLGWTHSVLTMHFFNPFSIWFFVVIMVGVEYIGYILSKVLGDKGGIIASGVVGGLISSTATTAAMTNRSKSHPGNRYAYASATLIASCIMFIRVIVISAFYSPAILETIIIPAAVMFITLVGSAYYFYRLSKQERIVKIEEKAVYKSPFQIVPALQFASVVVAIKFIAGIGLIYKDILNPQIFYYVLGALSGLADVDAITQDMASKSAENAIPMLIASSTILIAVMSNNIVKASIAKRFGEKVFGNAVFIGFAISILSGAIIIGVMNWMM